MRPFLRALMVLHGAFRHRGPRVRAHTLIRFLTCPFVRIVENVPVGASVLEIGAGHGVFSRLAADRASRVVAVEPDARKVAPLEQVHFVIGYDDAVRGTHDVVAIVDVLYKLPDSEWDPLLDRLFERLAPGGTLLVKEHDPTARVKNWWNGVQERLVSRVRLTLGESFNYEAPDAFVARLVRHGFDAVVARRIDSGYPHPHILYVARRPVRTDRG